MKLLTNLGATVQVQKTIGSQKSYPVLKASQQLPPNPPWSLQPTKESLFGVTFLQKKGPVKNKPKKHGQYIKKAQSVIPVGWGGHTLSNGLLRAQGEFLQKPLVGICA